MKLPSYRRIFKTDYANDFQPLIEKLAVSINYGFDTLYNALNNNLTFSENIASTITDITISVDKDGVPAKQNTKFKLNSTQTSVNGLLVLNCYEEKTPTAGPPSAVFINFTKNENYIVINNIKGLTAGISYVIKVLAIT